MYRIKHYYKQMSLTMKATMWFVFANILLKGMGFITTPLYTRVLSVDEYGILSLYLAYEQIILILATFEISLGAYQKGIFKYENNIEQFTVSTQILTNIITTVCFIFIFIFNKFITQNTKMDLPILLVLFIYLIVQPAYNNWLVLKRKNNEYKSVVIVTVLYGFGVAFGPLLGIVIFDNTAKVKFISQLLISTLFCIFFFIKTLKKRKYIGNYNRIKEQWKYIIVFQTPLVINSLSFLALGQADRIMIGIMVGDDKAGIYSIAYSLASLMALIYNALNQSMTPWRYNKLQEKQYNDISKNTDYILFFTMICTLLFIIVSPEIVKLLFSKTYYESMWAIPPIAVGMYFSFMSTIFINVETYFERTKFVTYISLFSSIVNIALNWLLIDMVGYIICGYTTLVSYIIMALGHYLVAEHICRNKNIKENVFDKKKIFCMSMIMLILSIVATMLYSNAIIRYGLLLIIVFLVYIFRKKFLYIARQIIKRQND